MRLSRLGHAHGDDPGRPQEHEIEPEEHRKAGGRPHLLDDGADEVIGQIADNHEYQVDDNQPHGALWSFAAFANLEPYPMNGADKARHWSQSSCSVRTDADGNS